MMVLEPFQTVELSHKAVEVLSISHELVGAADSFSLESLDKLET
jgi:hypothetical protein